MFLAWDKSPVLLSSSGGGKEESKGNAVYRRCSELSKVKDCEVQRMLMPLITLGQDKAWATWDILSSDLSSSLLLCSPSAELAFPGRVFRVQEAQLVRRVLTEK